MKKRLKIYHRLPYTLRVFAASVWGYYLRWWRYGPKTERFVEEVIEREQWSLDRWKVYQEEQLATILHRAATEIPYYRDQWSARRRNGDRASWEYLENWPILKKEPLRSHPHAFIAEDCDSRRMYSDHTSGTTGKPLTIWLSRETAQKWYALFEARVRLWNGVSRDDRWAMLGGQMVTAFDQKQPPFWVWNAGLSQLYLSPYHISPDFVMFYMDAIGRYGVEYILGYPSSMYALAELVLEKGINPPSLKVAISNAEALYPHQREAIEKAFQCSIKNTYGMVEIVGAASECKNGTMHLWPEVGIVDVLHDDVNESVQPGQTGRLVCTGLLNDDMPLIRYEVGDRGALDINVDDCGCGRSLPVLKSVEGRMADVILTPDGRRVWGLLGPTFGGLHVREGQLIQEKIDQIIVRFVPAQGYSTDEGLRMAERLKYRLGDVNIVVKQVDNIPRSANGKFRAVISDIISQNET
jgi:phenylacetate-CoA ligase